MNPAGRPLDNLERHAWCERFGLNLGSDRRNYMTDAFLAQLSLCRTDEARRLLLGVSEKEIQNSP
jgi:hypothetical protein